MDVESLTGHQWRYAPNGTAIADDLDRIRRALVRYTALTGATDIGDPLAPEALFARAANIHTLYQAANYSRVVRELPELLVAADQV